MDEQHLFELAGFRYALRRFVAASETINRDAGITQQQYQALLVIRTSSEPLSMRAFADQLLLTHHAAVQLIDRLSRVELVERRRSVEDRRSVQLVLTATGRTLLDDLAGKHLQEIRRQEPQLSRSLQRMKQSPP